MAVHHSADQWRSWFSEFEGSDLTVGQFKPASTLESGAEVPPRFIHPATLRLCLPRGGFSSLSNAENQACLTGSG